MRTKLSLKILREIPSYFDILHVMIGHAPYADRVEKSNVDGAKRDMVTIFELIDPRQYDFRPPVYGRSPCTAMYVSGRLLTQENSRLNPPPDLRSQ